MQAEDGCVIGFNSIRTRTLTEHKLLQETDKSIKLCGFHGGLGVSHLDTALHVILLVTFFLVIFVLVIFVLVVFVFAKLALGVCGPAAKMGRVECRSHTIQHSPYVCTASSASADLSCASFFFYQSVS